MLWKLALIALVILFLVADSIYLYFRLKKYWRRATWNRPFTKKSSWEIGLASLDIPAQAKPDACTRSTEKEN
ncbi:MAG: hypothetical protein JW832_15075 [Deltaproteobacteria bacterium]|nr:hypothetical protein [Deltaproteobacteria bacterium]